MRTPRLRLVTRATIKRMTFSDAHAAQPETTIRLAPLSSNGSKVSPPYRQSATPVKQPVPCIGGGTIGSAVSTIRPCRVAWRCWLPSPSGWFVS
jgi:hypothetical protein